MIEDNTVIYTQEAYDDLIEIHTYIAEKLLSPKIAVDQVMRIYKKGRTLEYMPERFALVEWEPWHSMGAHCVPVDNFVIFYLINDNTKTVNVFRVIYSGRDIEGVLNSHQLPIM